MSNKVVIGVGSNIDPQKNIDAARTQITSTEKLIAESPFVQTKPIGITNQPDFLNGAWLIETEKTLTVLDTYLKSIEDQLGRDRSLPQFGPRTIDLDIVVFNNQVIDNDIYKREFLYDAVKAVWPLLTK